MRRSSKILGIAIIVLICITGIIWYAVWREDPHGLLTVSFLNIGQGDAIFIEAPSGRQVLIDGGPGSSVVRELSKVMPWYDSSIDVVTRLVYGKTSFMLPCDTTSAIEKYLAQLDGSTPFDKAQDKPLTASSARLNNARFLERHLI